MRLLQNYLCCRSERSEESINHQYIEILRAAQDDNYFRFYKSLVLIKRKYNKQLTFMPFRNLQFLLNHSILKTISLHTAISKILF